MKVLVINSVLDYGSTGRLVRDLSEGSKNNDIDVRVIYGRKKQTNDQDALYVGNVSSFLWHLIMTKIFDRHGLHSNISTRKIIEEIELFQPDLVHLHNMHGYYVNVPKLLKYLKKYNKPIVWTLHDFWMISGGPASFHYGGCERWVDACVVANNYKSYPGSLVFRRAEKNIAWKKSYLSSMNNLYFVTVSHWQRKELQKSYLRNHPMTTIYNGLDLDLFHTKTKHSDSKKLELLAVANDWKKAKGLDDLLELSKQLEENEHLTLVGLSDKQLKYINNTDTLTVLGRTDGLEELVKCYQKADVYLNLSYEETMGMTTAEALACGTPCVTYDQTAVPEMIDKKVGQVVPAGNIEAVLEAARNVKQRKINPQVCREYAEKKFDKKNMIDAYLRLYEKLNEGE